MDIEDYADAVEIRVSAPAVGKWEHFLATQGITATAAMAVSIEMVCGCAQDGDWGPVETWPPSATRDYLMEFVPRARAYDEMARRQMSRSDAP